MSSEESQFFQFYLHFYLKAATLDVGVDLGQILGPSLTLSVIWYSKLSLFKVYSNILGQRRKSYW